MDYDRQSISRIVEKATRKLSIASIEPSKLGNSDDTGYFDIISYRFPTQIGLSNAIIVEEIEALSHFVRPFRVIVDVVFNFPGNDRR